MKPLRALVCATEAVLVGRDPRLPAPSGRLPCHKCGITLILGESGMAMIGGNDDVVPVCENCAMEVSKGKFLDKAQPAPGAIEEAARALGISHEEVVAAMEWNLAALRVARDDNKT